MLISAARAVRLGHPSHPGRTKHSRSTAASQCAANVTEDMPQVCLRSAASGGNRPIRRSRRAVGHRPSPRRSAASPVHGRPADATPAGRPRPCSGWRGSGPAGVRRGARDGQLARRRSVWLCSGSRLGDGLQRRRRQVPGPDTGWCSLLRRVSGPRSKPRPGRPRRVIERQERPDRDHEDSEPHVRVGDRPSQRRHAWAVRVR